MSPPQPPPASKKGPDTSCNDSILFLALLWGCSALSPRDPCSDRELQQADGKGRASGAQEDFG